MSKYREGIYIFRTENGEVDRVVKLYWNKLFVIFVCISESKVLNYVNSGIAKSSDKENRISQKR